MLRMLIILLTIGMALVSNIVSADIYRYVDEHGTVFYTDKPVGDDKPNRIKLQINSFSSPKVSSFKYDPSLISERKKSADVVMYSTTWCGYCRKARDYFRQQGIAFTEYDVEKSAKGKQDYQALNGRGVPIIFAGGKRMNGFSVAAFEKLYRR